MKKINIMVKKSLLMLFIASYNIMLNAQYSIPESYLEKAILIEFPNAGASGSGFFLIDSNNIYLVSARHVVFHDRFISSSGKMVGHRLIDTSGVIKFYSKNSDNTQASIMEINFSGLWDSGNLILGNNTDIMVARIGSIKRKKPDAPAPITYNSYIRRENSSFLNPFDVTQTLSFDSTRVSDDIFMIGYPKSLQLQQNIQYDFNRPLLRKGILSGKYQINKTLIIDCPSFFGNSGGPVIEIQDDNIRLVGIVTQLIPFTDSGKTFAINQNSGFSIIEPMDKVFDIIKQFK